MFEHHHRYEKRALQNKALLPVPAVGISPSTQNFSSKILVVLRAYYSVSKLIIKPFSPTNSVFLEVSSLINLLTSSRYPTPAQPYGLK